MLPSDEIRVVVCEYSADAVLYPPFHAAFGLHSPADTNERVFSTLQRQTLRALHTNYEGKRAESVEFNDDPPSTRLTQLL